MFIPESITGEHVELRAVVRRFLEHRSPETVIRSVVDDAPGFDVDLWRAMADQLGLQGLEIAEAHGGQGYGVPETTIVFEELGRGLVPSPYFATVALAAPLLEAVGDEAAQRRYLPEIAAGQLVATVAAAESAGSWQPRDLFQVRAERCDGNWRLYGEKTSVLNLDTAGVVFVVVGSGDGSSVFAVDPAAVGAEVVPLTALDFTQRVSKLRLDGASAELIGHHGAATHAVAAMLDRACLALAAQQTGAAKYLLQMCVDYANVRHQFGQPIGSFQAIKHKLADMACDVERMDAVVREGATAAGDDSPEFPVIATIAKVFCSEAFFRIATDTIQVHGGIGFTWEHPAHLYFRRAKASEFLLGSPTQHREVLLTKLAV